MELVEIGLNLPLREVLLNFIFSADVSNLRKKVFHKLKEDETIIALGYHKVMLQFLVSLHRC